MSASSSSVHFDWRFAGEAAGCGELGGGRLVGGWSGDGSSGC